MHFGTLAQPTSIVPGDTNASLSYAWVVLHVLASVIAWAFAVAATLGLLALLVWLLRVILRDSAGRPGLRALALGALTFGVLVLWSASRVVP